MKVCPFSWWSPGFGQRIQCAGVEGHSEPHRGPASGNRSQDRTAAWVSVGAEAAVPDGRWDR